MFVKSIIDYNKLFFKKNDFDLEEIYAHVYNKEKKETLVEHSQKTLDKANDIVSKLKLENILINLNYIIYEDWKNLFDGDNSEFKIMNKEHFNTLMLQLLGTLVYLHDVGKINKKFQNEKLNIKNSKGIDFFPDSKHSFYSYLLINEIIFSEKISKSYYNNNLLFFCTIFLSTIVDRHHSPLIDLYPTKFRTEKNFWKFLNENFEKNRKAISKVCEYTIINKPNGKLLERINYMIDDLNIDIPKIGYEQKIPENKFESLFFTYKLWYSLLVQSDSLATEEFFTNQNVKINYITNELRNELEQKFYEYKYNKNLEKKKDLLEKNVSEIKDIDDLRTKLFLEATKNLKKYNNSKVFYLEAPTGSGKTNISLAIALQLVKNNGLVRINYVYPYISIINQNYKVINETIGKKDTDQIVSKIYDNSDWLIENDEEENVNLKNQKFLNYPINVLTNTNFFNIFIKSSKKTNIKIIELCNTVVILDEIQNLPIKKWHYFAYIIDKVAKLYNIFFIIMSATLPNINLLIDNNKIKSLVENPQQYNRHPVLERVTYCYEKTDGTKEIEEIFTNYKKLIEDNSYKKLLLVVNSIIDSIKLYELILEYNKNKEWKTCLLNSTILDFKKKEVVELFNIADTKRKIVLISTQSVEAGLDIDCDAAIRADAPLDSIEQVAGRVNRNGKKDKSKSKVVIVDSKTKEYTYRQDERAKIDLNLTKEFLFTRDFEGYYKIILERIKGKEQQGRENYENLILPMKLLKFDELNKQNYIEDLTLTIFLPIELNKNIFAAYENYLKEFNLAKNDSINGNDVWNIYNNIKKDRQFGEKDFRKIRFILKNFCINLHMNTYLKKFIESIKENYFASESEEIIKVDCNIVKKYYNSEYCGLDLQKIKEDFNLNENNFI